VNDSVPDLTTWQLGFLDSMLQNCSDMGKVDVGKVDMGKVDMDMGIVHYVHCANLGLGYAHCTALGSE